MARFKKKKDNEVNQASKDSVFEETNVENPEEIFGDIGLDSSTENNQELPSDGSIKIAYDADGNGYYVSYDLDNDRYYDPYSDETYDVSLLYDENGNAFSFSSGEYWEQFVGVDGYGYYDANNEWQWTGYFDDNNEWHSLNEEPLETTNDNSDHQEGTPTEVLQENVAQNESINYDNQQEEPQVTTDSEVVTTANDNDQPTSEAPLYEAQPSNVETIDENNNYVQQEQVNYDQPVVEELVAQETPNIDNQVVAVEEQQVIEQPNYDQQPTYEEPLYEAQPSNVETIDENNSYVQQEQVSYDQQPIVEELVAQETPNIENQVVTAQEEQQVVEQPNYEAPLYEAQPSNVETLDESNNYVQQEQVSYDQPVAEELVAQETPNIDNQVVADQEQQVVEQPNYEAPLYEVRSIANEPTYEVQAIAQDIVETPVIQEKVNDSQSIVSELSDNEVNSEFLRTESIAEEIVAQKTIDNNQVTISEPFVSVQNEYVSPALVQQESCINEQCKEPTINVIASNLNTPQPTIVENVSINTTPSLKTPEIVKERDLEIGIQYTTEVLLSIPKDDIKDDISNELEKKEVVNIKEKQLGSTMHEKKQVDIPVCNLNQSSEKLVENSLPSSSDFNTIDNESFKPVIVPDLIIKSNNVSSHENLVTMKTINQEIPKRNLDDTTQFEYIPIDNQFVNKVVNLDDCKEDDLINNEVELEEMKEQFTIPDELLFARDSSCKTNAKSLDETKEDYEIMTNKMNIDLPLPDTDNSFDTDYVPQTMMSEKEIPKSSLLLNDDYGREFNNEQDISISILAGNEPVDLSDEDLFGIRHYDETMKLSLSKIFDFLTKSHQKSTSTYKRISHDLKREIINVIRILEKSKNEYRENEKQITMKRNELIRALSLPSTNQYQKSTNGREFDKLQNLEDYNKHLLATIHDNEQRLRVLQENLSNLRHHYEKGVMRINNDVSRMQRLVASLSSSSQNNIHLLESNLNSLRENDSRYQNIFNEFDRIGYDSLKSSGSDLIPKGLYSKSFGNNSLLDDFNSNSTLYNPTSSLDFDSSFSDDLFKRSSKYNTSNWFDNDFESLKPDRTSDLTNLLDDDFESKF